MKAVVKRRLERVEGALRSDAASGGRSNGVYRVAGGRD